MNVIDTNIWIYCYDERDAEKHRLAKETVKAVRPLALPWQVGCEFMAACRKLERFGFAREQAWKALSHMQQVSEKILLPDVSLWASAREIQQRLGLSFWDALLVSACILGGAAKLYSEDFGTLRNVGDLEIVNPFIKGTGAGAP